MTGEREPAQRGWFLVRRYPDVGSALEAYEATRDLLLEADLEASIFRFQLNGLNHLCILGEFPLDAEIHSVVEALLERGEEVEVPPEVESELRVRRQRFLGLGL